MMGFSSSARDYSILFGIAIAAGYVYAILPPRKPEVQEIVEDLIERCSDQEAETTDNLTRDLFEMEKRLLSKFVECAKKEIRAQRALSDTDKLHLKLIWRFYFAFVPYMKRHLRKSFQDEPCSVFIAHAGSQKDKKYPLYADNVVDLLNHEQVEDVFLDDGTQSSEDILTATLCCEHFWCVATQDFLTCKRTLRQYVICCCRFILEGDQSPGGFCLLMDCLESGAKTGRWMEHILNFTTLKPYDDPWGFRELPGQMKRMLHCESPNDRRSRLAFEAGIVTQLPTRSDGAQSTAQVYNWFPMGRFCRALASKTTRKVRLLNSFLGIDSFYHELRMAIRNGAKVEILMMDPKSEAASRRSSSLHTKTDIVQSGLERDLNRLAEILRSYFRSSPEKQNLVKVRLYSVTPPFAIYQIDKLAYIGLYWLGSMVSSMPHIEVLDEPRSSTFFYRINDQFNIIWESGSELRWNGYGYDLDMGS